MLSDSPLLNDFAIENGERIDERDAPSRPLKVFRSDATSITEFIVFDQARVAVLDVFDAPEQFRNVERLLVHGGHHRHQEIEPLEKAPLR